MYFGACNWSGRVYKRQMGEIRPMTCFVFLLCSLDFENIIIKIIIIIIIIILLILPSYPVSHETLGSLSGSLLLERLLYMCWLCVSLRENLTLHLCVFSVVRMASSESTRELALKTTS